MAAAAAVSAADASPVAPAKKGKKKLLMLLVVGMLVLLLAGAGAVFMLKKKAAAASAEDGDDGGGATPSAAHKVEKPDLMHPPVFLPLDAFVVNLADKDADRYAQIGITLEVEDPKFGEVLKAYMPAIRNAILLILAQKSSTDLLDRPGKEQLAGEIQREAARVMGFDVEEPEIPAKAAAKDGAKDSAKGEADDEDRPKARKKRRANAEPNPIKHVHFSNFIIQ